MDTIENSAEPVGSDGATSSPDTSAEVDTQPQSPDPSVSDGASGQDEGQAASTLLAGKYKSPADLEKAYKSLEEKLGPLGQKAKAADLLEEKFGVTPDQLAHIIATQEEEARQQRYAGNPLLPVLDQVSELRQKVEAQEAEKAQLLVEKELDGFIQENEAYAPFKDELRQLALTSGIGFDPNTGEDVPLDTLAQRFFGKAIASGQQAAYEKIEVKKNTQPTGVASTPKKGITREDMEAMTAAELEAYLTSRGK